MSQWVRLCAVGEAPAEGGLVAAEVDGKSVCVARVGGELLAVDNVCPHRQAPLAEGWIEDGKLICPWHSWTFNLRTGVAEFPEGERVEPFELRVEGGDVLVKLS